MNGLRSFTAAFCTVCVLTGGLYLLAPNGRAGKSVRYVFGLIFLICLLSVIPGIRSVRTDFPPVTAQPQNVLQSETVRETFETTLQSANIPYKKIWVETDNLPSGGIRISKVSVETNADAATVRELLGGENAAYEIEIIGG